MYYDYKKTSDTEIRSYLDKIKIVVETNCGVGTLHGYYPLTEQIINQLKEKPRNLSLSFDATEIEKEPLKNLVVFKTIKYLVKSTSRFFLKPDIGEIFDQIHFLDLSKTKAIEYLPYNFTEIADTNGEHFVMEANLLREKL